MFVVGLGKHDGASAYHAAALRLGYGEALMRLAGVVLARAPVLGGVALVENGLHETTRVEVLATAAIPRRESELCAEAAAMMPSLPFDEIDLLIVDQIGKNISGTGMDTNTIGRWGSGYRLVPDATVAKPFIWRIFVRGLTPESHGNPKRHRTGRGDHPAVARRHRHRSAAYQLDHVPLGSFGQAADGVRDRR
ncbi:MAG: hypothetical protein CM1200mP34_1720 [Verrucomicrobiales bacterium]|nr:MAG: hypothetical protein CM1200mP34_1720 [Verrucomicrobiales bacterium]